jgi:protein-S-isoprenylcysteine O-methyltransferase Ste14
MSHVHRTRRHGPPTLGRRGGGWVAVQVALIAGILLSALAGRGWSSTLAPLAYALGGVAFFGGTALLLAGGVGLGNALTPFPAPREGGGLRTAGAYRLVRHPMYGGGILIGVGWSIVFATPLGLGLTVLLALFAGQKARREELWLEQAHLDYDDYRRRTPHRFIPFLW